MPSAIGRSNAPASLRRSAGARLMTVRPDGPAVAEVDERPLDAVDAFADGQFGQADENGLGQLGRGRVHLDLDRHRVDADEGEGAELGEHGDTQMVIAAFFPRVRRSGDLVSGIQPLRGKQLRSNLDLFGRHVSLDEPLVDELDRRYADNEGNHHDDGDEEARRDEEVLLTRGVLLFHFEERAFEPVAHPHQADDVENDEGNKDGQRDEAGEEVHEPVLDGRGPDLLGVGLCTGDIIEAAVNADDGVGRFELLGTVRAARRFHRPR